MVNSCFVNSFSDHERISWLGRAEANAILKSMKFNNLYIGLLLLGAVFFPGCGDYTTVQDGDSLDVNSTDFNSTDADFQDVNSTDVADVEDLDAGRDAGTADAGSVASSPQKPEPPKELTEKEKVEQWLETVGAYTSKEYIEGEGFINSIEFKDLVIRAERVKSLKVFPLLDSLSFSKCTFEKGALDEFRAFPRIKYANFMNSNVTGDAIKFLIDAENLETLRILYFEIDEAAFEVLGQLDQVKHVSFWDVGVTPENMGFLAGMKSVEILNLYRNTLPTLDWDVLSQMEHLRELWIQEAKITDAGLAEVSRSPNLTKLILSRNNLTDQSLEQIGKLHQLEFLMLGGNQIHGEGLAHLTTPTLKTIYMANNPFTEASMPHLQKVYSKLADFSPKRRSKLGFVEYVKYFGDQFTFVDVEFYKDRGRSSWSNIEVSHHGRGHSLYFYEKLTPECFAAIGKCTNLVNLEIEGIDISDEYYAANLGGLKKLRFLKILGSEIPITDDMSQVFDGCERLESFAMDNVAWSSKGFGMFQSMPDLERLELKGGKVDGTGVQQLAGLGKLVALTLSKLEFTKPMSGLPGLAGLKHLFLNGSRLTMSDFKAISTARQLEMLCLDDTKTTDQDIASFRSLMNLGHMSLRNTNVTPVGLMAIARPENELNYINHEGSQISDEEAQVLANRFEWTFGGACSCGCLDYSPEY